MKYSKYMIVQKIYFLEHHQIIIQTYKNYYHKLQLFKFFICFYQESRIWDYLLIFC